MLSSLTLQVIAQACKYSRIPFRSGFECHIFMQPRKADAPLLPQEVSSEKQAVGSARTNEVSYHKNSESVSPPLESKHKRTLAVWCKGRTCKGSGMVQRTDQGVSCHRKGSKWCDEQTPICVLPAWTNGHQRLCTHNTLKVRITCYQQSPQSPPGKSKKITHRHTCTHWPETWINKHTVQSHHLSGTDCRGPLAGLSWCLSNLIIFSDLCLDIQHNWAL